MKILPSAMPIAITNELNSIEATGSRNLARGALHDDPVVVLGHVRAGHERHVAVCDGRSIVGGGDKGQIDRKGDDQNADREDEIGDEIAEGAVLDHQYCTLRST